MPATLVLFLLTCPCRALFYNVPGLKDYRIFPFRQIQNSPQSVFCFDSAPPCRDYGKLIPANDKVPLPDAVTLDKYASESRTAAYLVIRNDTILYDKIQ